jgi:tRNA (guanine37-N1)-methyltransferase
MVMQAGPLVEAIESAVAARGPAQRILMTPVGRPLVQARVRELARLPRLLLVCGRYEGVDERVRDLAIDEEISLGDFVLTGGEPAAMALVDAIARYVPGVLGDATSADDESFSTGLLEYPQYTRPPEFRGAGVPEVLLGGDHKKVRGWREEQARARTQARRPDLWGRVSGGSAPEPRVEREDQVSRPGTDPLAEARRALAARTTVALVHHPVYDKNRQVVTTAVTNLDVHDIARSSRTFGLPAYLLVTPIQAQRELCERILGHWTEGAGLAHNAKRSEALEHVSVVASVDAAIARVTEVHGQKPYVVATAAKAHGTTMGSDELISARAADPGRPMLLLFGTGWGLIEDVFTKTDASLHPISGGIPYNHLSVRSAAAIVLDRLFGISPK